ncbi:hypothetical protein C3K47_11955 [Solitalea longa]|uniref:Uncharacterized protein n=1 Tax=Solitalea longa TaxID=2079460 RepID=A0A2S5A1H4_9SPHI|nr:hypothetical protein [Solitalea longa]POY36450.1 hypothetical protein C3K47_11955 [Solitalea longa]
MSVLAPFEISIAHEGLSCKAFVTANVGDEAIEFEITLDDRKFRIFWNNNMEQEIPNLFPRYFSPDAYSFNGNTHLYKAIVGELLEVLCDRIINLSASQQVTYGFSNLILKR